ncbi:hypothetical protein [Actinoplanes sp. NPDC051494]|uniref:hypothetical protein n=1 Tax=Actinoplanes sp. NPDC051494 TaxID=3363907 RepID=UPI0037A8263C
MTRCPQATVPAGSESSSSCRRSLGEVAATWAALDPREFPFVRGLADRLRDHDDRAQFLAGVDLILAGIATLSGGE